MPAIAMYELVRVIPESYLLDRTALLNAHKAGLEIPADFTVVQGRSLRIR